MSRSPEAIARRRIDGLIKKIEHVPMEAHEGQKEGQTFMSGLLRLGDLERNILIKALENFREDYFRDTTEKTERMSRRRRKGGP